MTETNKQLTVIITEKDLPLACPQPDAPLWSRHPRVFLEIAHNKEAVCPYCSTHYVFEGEMKRQH